MALPAKQEAANKTLVVTPVSTGARQLDVMQEIKYREMILNDYDAVIDLMGKTPGITVREADSRSATENYLKRNPGLNFVAELNEELVGCVMCGHDGRRGYLQHLAVKENKRRNGIGTELVLRCLAALERIGIKKTHIHVLQDNELANNYWSAKKWNRRDDLHVYSWNGSADPNA